MDKPERHLQYWVHLLRDGPRPRDDQPGCLPFGVHDASVAAVTDEEQAGNLEADMIHNVVVGSHRAPESIFDLGLDSPLEETFVGPPLPSRVVARKVSRGFVELLSRYLMPIRRRHYTSFIDSLWRLVEQYRTSVSGKDFAGEGVVGRPAPRLFPLVVFVQCRFVHNLAGREHHRNPRPLKGQRVHYHIGGGGGGGGRLMGRSRRGGAHVAVSNLIPFLRM